MLGGNSTTGTVTLNGPAPAGGFTVSLSSNLITVNVPASLTIPAGAVTGMFTINTQPVGSSTSVTITAKSGVVSKTAVLTIVPPTLASITVSPTSVVGGSTTAVKATVSLSGAVPTGRYIVVLTSSDPSVTVPATVNIVAPHISASFPVTHKKVTTVTKVTLTAKAAGLTKTTVLTLTP